MRNADMQIGEYIYIYIYINILIKIKTEIGS